MKKTRNKILLILMLSLIMCSMFAVSAFAAETGDVAGAVEDTWNAAKGQIKQVVNNVVFHKVGDKVVYGLTVENVDSKEFIEQMAREKLDMYYPNERVYVDNGM